MGSPGEPRGELDREPRGNPRGIDGEPGYSVNNQGTPSPIY